MKKPIKPTQDTFTLVLKAQTGIIAVKEYMFHDKRKWRFDYAIHSHDGKIVKLAIEVMDRDDRNNCGKFDLAKQMGWFIMPVKLSKLMNLRAFEAITVLISYLSDVDNYEQNKSETVVCKRSLERKKV